MNGVRPFLIHLRLPFQLALAPFFLLGAYLAGGPLTGAWALVFLAVHVGLYGGATVYNSYYDRDEGPIGMLKRPPVVTRGMRDASVALQVVAVALVLAVAPWAGVVTGALALLGVAYSHPRWRWKSATFKGLAVVALGQGALAFLLGHLATGPNPPDERAWGVAAAASLLVLGLYPLTQIYQIDEDRARGDLTLGVRYGWRSAMGFAGVVATAGLVALCGALSPWLPVPWWAAAAGAACGLAGFLIHWGRRFETLGPYGNHDRAMALSLAVATPVAVLLLAGLARRMGA